ncbi:MAG: iron ABC transporter permease [Paludibacteraceae bacterium]|nr:iron ABC transporter permease [Paludibacteraceae bacterium]MBP5482503.1 iron ABC transporter permease [Paludibacteraceae bacterium]
MNRKRLVFIILFSLSIVLFVVDVLFGSVDIPFSEFVALLKGSCDPIHRTIMVDIRIPKAITAVLVGISLSVSGLWMQTLFRNPLVGPYVLGISSGASLGVAVYLLLFSALGISSVYVSGWGVAFSSMIGAALLFLLVISVSFRLREKVSLLIAGIMLGCLATSAISLLQNISDPDSVKMFVNWTLGSLSGVTWEKLRVMALFVGIGVVFVPFLLKPLDAMLLGDDYASSIGVDVRRMRWMIILSATLLTGATTAFTGPIGFIGIAVPHIVRGLLQTSVHRLLTPCCMLCGAVLVLLCDIFSQLPGDGYVLPVNALSSLIGAPVVLWIILSNKR